MLNNNRLLSRHVFSMFVSVLTTSVLLFVVVMIKVSSNSGPISDMAGVAFFYGCPFLCLFFFLPTVLGVAGVSEIGRIYLGEKFNWITTPLMFLIFILISYSILFLFGYRSSILEQIPSTIHRLVFPPSIGISLFGLLYWVLLLYSKTIFVDGSANQKENN